MEQCRPLSVADDFGHGFQGHLPQARHKPKDLETAREPPSHQEQAHPDEDQHDGQYRLEGFAWDVGREPASDQDAGDTAE